MKIAVPVDGENRVIVERTGRSPFFALYEIQDDSYTFLELTPNEHKHHHHAEGEEEEVRQHQKELGRLIECKYLLCLMIGPHMGKALSLSGVKVKVFRNTQAQKADELVEEFLASL